MSLYESLIVKAKEAASIPNAVDRHNAKDWVNEEIEEAECGFDALPHEKAEEIRRVLYTWSSAQS